MRGCDMDTTGPVWSYRPARHKNRNRGLDRVIFLGPKAQAVVRPFLKADAQAYLFAPADAVAARDTRRAAARKTRKTPSELRRAAARKARPRLRARPRYDRNSYRQAVHRGCDRATRARLGLGPCRPCDLVPRWSPLQLRHTAATALRARYGVEAARVVLGHSRVETSQIYAERNLGKAEEVMREVG
jgi:integrase